MKSYIGTKIVSATPMNRQEYNEYRMWQLPADENGADEGYLVEYMDGGKPNHPGHEGYISWSPKEQFEKAYIEIGGIESLAPHQQRVAAEKAELDARREKLITFLHTPTFASLNTDEQERLTRQIIIMDDLSAVLGERICAFEVQQ